MNTPAMIIDFEATDVSKEAEATQLGWRKFYFNGQGALWSAPLDSRNNSLRSPSVFCRPYRAISYGAMAVSHITPADIAGATSHKMLVPQYLPVGEAYIVGHNVDFDIQVAANAGVDVSQYKRICTQALARKMLPNLDSHSLGALTYATKPELARHYCRHAHDAGWDVTFTLWLLEHLCELGNIDSMEQLYLASEDARIPTAFTFGKYYGRKIADIAREDRGYLQWVMKNNGDDYLIGACKRALAGEL